MAGQATSNRSMGWHGSPFPGSGAGLISSVPGRENDDWGDGEEDAGPVQSNTGAGVSHVSTCDSSSEIDGAGAAPGSAMAPSFTSFSAGAAGSATRTNRGVHLNFRSSKAPFQVPPLPSETATTTASFERP